MLAVGAARLPLPMPPGLPLAGYLNRAGNATGVHDPLFARAFVAADGPDAICLLSLDTLCVDAAFVAEVRERIAASSGIRPEAILIAATHTHSAPAGVARFDLDRASALYLGAPNPALRREVQDALVQATAQAAARLAPARLFTGTGHVEDVARNRIRRDGLYDPDIPFVLAVDAAGRVVAAIYSLASHSTVLGPGNLAYSGDLIGAICRSLEAKWGGESVVLGLAGAAGDISTRFTRNEASVAEVDRLAARAAQAIAGERSTPEAGHPLRAARAAVLLALSPAESPAILQARLADARQRLAALAVTAASERRLAQAEVEGLEMALMAGQNRPDALQTEVQVLRMGRVVIAAYPGEMFVAFGLATRQALRDSHVLIAGYANDYIGYVPTPETAGGYEATMALVGPDSGLRLVEAVCALAKS